MCENSIPNDPNKAVEMALVDSGLPKRVRYFPRGTALEIEQYEFTARTEHHCELAALHDPLFQPRELGRERFAPSPWETSIERTV